MRSRRLRSTLGKAASAWMIAGCAAAAFASAGKSTRVPALSKTLSPSPAALPIISPPNNQTPLLPPSVISQQAPVLYLQTPASAQNGAAPSALLQLQKLSMAEGPEEKAPELSAQKASEVFDLVGPGTPWGGGPPSVETHPTRYALENRQRILDYAQGMKQIQESQKIAKKILRNNTFLVPGSPPESELYYLSHEHERDSISNHIMRDQFQLLSDKYDDAAAPGRTRAPNMDKVGSVLADEPVKQKARSLIKGGYVDEAVSLILDETSHLSVMISFLGAIAKKQIAAGQDAKGTFGRMKEKIMLEILDMEIREMALYHLIKQQTMANDRYRDWDHIKKNGHILSMMQKRPLYP